MDLKSRLRETFGYVEAPVPGAAAPIPLSGREVRNEGGCFWMKRSDFPRGYRHGSRCLDEALTVDPEALALLAADQALRTFDPRQALFIDTETTSLAGGAGVYVFMTGVGYFVDDGFRVDQYFMRDFDEEPAMLLALQRFFTPRTAMVSYFGKNFDRYRLEDRFAAQGLKSSLPVGCHLDLYHAGRRLYKGRFPDLKLKTLEQERLGFKRHGDLPGALCPEVYFQYLNGADGGRIHDVFCHNLWDILSLSTLAAEMDGAVKRPRTPHDCFALACMLMGAGEDEAASCWLERAGDGFKGRPEAFEVHYRRVKLLKRRGDLTALEQELDRLHQAGPDRPEALEELAKFYEHRRKDPKSALQFACRARLLLERGDDGTLRSSRLLQGIARRIQRLKTKTGTL